MSVSKQFLYVIHPTRPAMLVEGLDARESAIVEEHFAWLQRQQAQGVVRMAGRTADSGERTFGIVLLEVPSEEAARALMLEDPAVAQGVIPASVEPRLPQAQEAFQKLVARRALERPPAAGLSPLKDLLAISVPPDSDPPGQQAKQERLANLLTRHRDDTDALWTAVKEEFGPDVEGRMRLDGKLARLTGSSCSEGNPVHGE